MPSSDPVENNIQSALPPGRYEITRLLGRGGFGRAYAARDVVRSKSVVLKMMEIPTPAAHARVKREIAVFGQLPASPYVVGFLDVYLPPSEDMVVLASEYFEGGTLQGVVDGLHVGLPGPVIAAVLRQLCLGLEHLHRQGIVHRDIKPSNVLVTQAGAVKLLDLGIAVSTEAKNSEGGGITTVGNFVGTLRYAAPEMIRDEGYGPASDVYAVGVTTLFLLLGRQPLENAPLGTLVQQVLQGALLHELPASLRDPWQKVLERMLDAQPARRLRPEQVRAALDEVFPVGAQADEGVVSAFLQTSGSLSLPAPPPPAIVRSPTTLTDRHSLTGAVQSLSAQMQAVQATFSDVTMILKTRELNLGSVPAAPLTPAGSTTEQKLDLTFAAVRRRLEWNWRMSLFMTLTLFSLFVAMLVLAVVFGAMYQRSYWGVVFGGTSALSLLTVVVWKPMDKMLFSTIATQQLELIQLNYQNALSGSRAERREAFRDVSAQLGSLLTKITSRSKS